MKRLIAAAVVVLGGVGIAAAGDTRVNIPTDLSPLKARVALNKDTYTLDPTQKGAEFRKKLREAPVQGGIGPNGIIQQGIQIQAVPVPAPVPVPALPRKVQRVPAIPLQPVPAKEDKPKDAAEKKPVEKKAPDKKEPKKDDKDVDVQVEGAVQGVIIIGDGQGGVTVKDLIPDEEKKEDKDGKQSGPAKKSSAPADKNDPKDAKKGDKGQAKKDEKPKEGEEGAFRIQAQGGQIQVQGNIQIQGGVPGGPAQVQIIVMGAGPQRPLPPEVDMELEIRNTTGREMVLLVGPGQSQVDLKLEGPGAVTASGGVAFIAEGRREVKLAPEGTHKIPIKRLQHGPNGQTASYWTEPGEYTLTATFKAVQKAESDAQKDKPIEVTAPAVKIKVVEAK